jgi:hypothetical protein
VIRMGDILLAVNQKPVKEWTIAFIREQIQGKPGSFVIIDMMRPEDEEQPEVRFRLNIMRGSPEFVDNTSRYAPKIEWLSNPLQITFSSFLPTCGPFLLSLSLCLSLCLVSLHAFGILLMVHSFADCVRDAKTNHNAYRLPDLGLRQRISSTCFGTSSRLLRGNTSDSTRRSRLSRQNLRR